MIRAMVVIALLLLLAALVVITVYGDDFIRPVLV